MHRRLERPGVGIFGALLGRRAACWRCASNRAADCPRRRYHRCDVAIDRQLGAQSFKLCRKQCPAERYQTAVADGRAATRQAHSNLGESDDPRRQLLALSEGSLNVGHFRCIEAQLSINSKPVSHNVTTVFNVITVWSWLWNGSELTRSQGGSRSAKSRLCYRERSCLPARAVLALKKRFCADQIKSSTCARKISKHANVRIRASPPTLASKSKMPARPPRPW